jgi:hypothetical protein
MAPSHNQLLIWKHTALALCEHHKRTCDGETCNISLFFIREITEAAGVVFTPAEKEEFR